MRDGRTGKEKIVLERRLGDQVFFAGNLRHGED